MAFEQLPMSLREKVSALAAEAIARGKPASWFEQLYRDAAGEAAQIPWAKLTPHPDLSAWLATQDSTGSDRQALVIGCGLGDDAEALQALGYRVIAFDIAPSAIAWCQQRFPDSTVTYEVADLLALPTAWQEAFDLVVECRNVQALPLSVRAQTIRAVGTTVAADGTLLVITRVRETEAAPDGPPWPLSPGELAEFTASGLEERGRAIAAMPEIPGLQQGWIEYRKCS